MLGSDDREFLPRFVYWQNLNQNKGKLVGTGFNAPALSQDPTNLPPIRCSVAPTIVLFHVIPVVLSTQTFLVADSMASEELPVAPSSPSSPLSSPSSPPLSRLVWFKGVEQTAVVHASPRKMQVVLPFKRKSLKPSPLTLGMSVEGLMSVEHTVHRLRVSVPAIRQKVAVQGCTGHELGVIGTSPFVLDVIDSTGITNDIATVNVTWHQRVMLDTADVKCTVKHLRKHVVSSDANADADAAADLDEEERQLSHANGQYYTGGEYTYMGGEYTSLPSPWPTPPPSPSNAYDTTAGAMNEILPFAQQLNGVDWIRGEVRVFGYFCYAPSPIYTYSYQYPPSFFLLSQPRKGSVVTIR
jgi:hypothetical protein